MRRLKYKVSALLIAVFISLNWISPAHAYDYQRKLESCRVVTSEKGIRNFVVSIIKDIPSYKVFKLDFEKCYGNLESKRDGTYYVRTSRGEDGACYMRYYNTAEELIEGCIRETIAKAIVDLKPEADRILTWDVDISHISGSIYEVKVKLAYGDASVKPKTLRDLDKLAVYVGLNRIENIVFEMGLPGDEYNTIESMSNNWEKALRDARDCLSNALPVIPVELYSKKLSGKTYRIAFVSEYQVNTSEKERLTFSKALEILQKIITPNMSDRDKVKAIHDYLVKHTEYDFDNYLNKTIPKESYSAYGALIKGIAVCQGYSEAFNLLANLAGVPSIIVSGEASGYGGYGSHAWNLVLVDGEVRHVDVTWDDLVPDRDPDYVRYDYFLVTDKEICKDHNWDRGAYVGKDIFYIPNLIRDVIPLSNISSLNETEQEEPEVYEPPEPANVTVVLHLNSREITVLNNNVETKVTLDVSPYCPKGTTLVPLRGILEALGAEVKWVPETKQVIVSKDGVTVTLTIGSKIAWVNGTYVTLTEPAQIVNNRTMIPLRFVSESLGYTINWNGNTQKITISECN